MYMKDNPGISKTRESDYTNLLIRKQMVWWKHLFNVQAPYRWNLQHLRLGFTLEVGCGIGRNLAHLKRRGVGIDYNPHSVELACRRGLIAFTPEEFRISNFNRLQKFDSILLSHVAEHINQEETIKLLRQYIPLLKPHGRIIIITPQEAGFRRDLTHVEFMDFTKTRKIAQELGFSVLKEYSFPFPRLFGYFFPYNEFVSVIKAF